MKATDEAMAAKPVRTGLEELELGVVAAFGPFGHPKSPAQWPVSPQAWHWVRLFNSFNFRLRSSSDRFERGISNLPLRFDLFLFFPFPLSLRLALEFCQDKYATQSFWQHSATSQGGASAANKATASNCFASMSSSRHSNSSWNGCSGIALLASSLAT